MTTFNQLVNRLRNVPTRKFLTALPRDGFLLVPDTIGSHRVFEHPDGRRAEVPYHKGGDKGGDPPTRTALQRILQATEWNEDDAIRLKLLKR